MLRILFTLLLASACSTIATQAPPPRAGGQQDPIGLFPSDAAVLPDEVIARILDAR